ncbi:MAG TPA: Mur ligase domain-containing protein, partial [Candidatus Levybacteria bacterium]|nr:Mur ligase domain-containing protein [Candidatus Levybacteria bacterium]
MKELPYKKIYFVGIKGVGMTALAVIAKQAGYQVRGSDVAETFITDSTLASHDIVVDTHFST